MAASAIAENFSCTFKRSTFIFIYQALKQGLGGLHSIKDIDQQRKTNIHRILNSTSDMIYTGLMLKLGDPNTFL